jgi:two-component system, NtrC family, nitrogen regulation sensor histidine kinase NtrY
MIIKRLSFLIILKLSVFGITSAGWMFLYQRGTSWILQLLLGLLLVLETIDFIKLFHTQYRKLAYFFEAIRNEDTTLVFPNNVKDKSLVALYKSLNDLNQKISEIKIKNETNERFFKELIEHSSTGLMSLDQDGYVEIMNSAAKKYLGVVHLSKMSLLKQKNQELHDAIMSTKFGEKRTIKTIVSNELIVLSLQSSDVRFGDKTYQLISLQDIGHELEENEIDSWQKLIRVMTHEIMNSIAPITSLTHTLLNFYHHKDRPKLPEELNKQDVSNTIEGLTIIEDRGKGLIHFVDNYRRMAKVPKPVFAPLAIDSWAHRIGLLFQPELLERGIEFTTSINPLSVIVLTDEKLLSQVLINLITNAIDSIPAGSANRKIKLSVQKTHTDSIQIILSDSGCGIDEALMDKIFVPFFTTKEGGNGIGLSLSRQIIRKLNGKLSVKSVLGHGSQFIVEL